MVLADPSTKRRLMLMMLAVPQFACFLGRGLSDARSWVSAFAKGQASGTPSTRAAPGAGRWHVFAEGEIPDILHLLRADASLVSLIHSLRHKSHYRLPAQDEHREVQTAAGVKQTYKRARLYFTFSQTSRARNGTVAAFGDAKVLDFFAGHADDLTIHPNIKSLQELAECQGLTRALLASLHERKLLWSSSKCSIFANLRANPGPRMSPATR